MTRAHRRGFGTVATLVLVILGIAMFILVVQQMMTQGTSISIGRAYATAQVLRVGRMALEEAFLSKKGKELIQKTLVKGLAEAGRQIPGATAPNESTPEGRDQLIRSFLNTIYLAPASTAGRKLAELFADAPDNNKKIPVKLGLGTADIPVKGATWVNTGRSSCNGNVEFDADDTYSAKYKPETLEAAYKTEIENGTLKVEDVQVRVVAFRHVKANGANPPADGVAIWGHCLMRARVKLRWVLPREVEGKAIAINRTLTEDRVFDLESPPIPEPPGSPQTKDWEVAFRQNEWQRGASE